MTKKPTPPDPRTVRAAERKLANLAGKPVSKPPPRNLARKGPSR
jgi:hypothetical protein